VARHSLNNRALRRGSLEVSVCWKLAAVEKVRVEWRRKVSARGSEAGWAGPVRRSHRGTSIFSSIPIMPISIGRLEATKSLTKKDS